MELRCLISSRHLTWDHLVWKDGLANWLAVGDSGRFVLSAQQGLKKKGGSFKRPLIQKSTKVLPISILKLPRPLIQLPCRDEPATEGDFFGTADLQALAFLDRLDVGACLHEGIVGECSS